MQLKQPIIIEEEAKLNSHSNKNNYKPKNKAS